MESSERLIQVLNTHFNARVKYKELVDLRGFLVASFRPNRFHLISLRQETSEMERVYLLTHFGAHLILGHQQRPFTTIIEPSIGFDGRVKLRKPEEGWRLKQHQEADILTSAILEDHVNVFYSNISQSLGADRSNNVLIQYFTQRARLLRNALESQQYPMIGLDKW